MDSKSSSFIQIRKLAAVSVFSLINSDMLGSEYK